MELERLYAVGQVYNKVLDAYYKFMVPPAVFGGGAAIVFLSFVTLRHTELPLYIYWLFPYMTISFSVVLFDLCYDGILVIRASEASLSTLRSKEGQYFRRLPIEEQKAMSRRAKALRPAFFSVGNFAQFDMSMPIGVWDEMVNQLMFLLTL